MSAQNKKWPHERIHRNAVVRNQNIFVDGRGPRPGANLPTIISQKILSTSVVSFGVDLGFLVLDQFQDLGSLLDVNGSDHGYT